MKLLDKIRDYMKSKNNHLSVEPVYYDINEMPDSMTIDEVAEYRDRFNIVFYDSTKQKRKPEAGFKQDNS